jgi:FMN reductase
MSFAVMLMALALGSGVGLPQRCGVATEKPLRVTALLRVRVREIAPTNANVAPRPGGRISRGAIQGLPSGRACEISTSLTASMTVVVVGNPKPMSRTRAAAELVAEKLTGVAPQHVIDVVDLGAGLLGWGDPKVAEAKAIVKAADSLVVASPTFKATYTGLLKLFLDQFGAGELGQITTFALMLGGSYAHALAPELSLRPVLVEIGASCPAPSLYLLDSEYETSEDLEKWLAVARRFVPAVSS